METAKKYALTLVFASSGDADIDRAAVALAGIGASLSGPKTLSPKTAFDFELCTQAEFQQTRTQIGEALAGFAADFCLQDQQGRRKSLLICDMDSTLIGQECIDELADFAGVKEQVSAITERAMRGELDFEAALKERVGLLKGLPLTALRKCFDERIALNPGARTLAATMKSHGSKTVIVSGGFTFFTGLIANAAGFDAHQANTLLDDGRALTGAPGNPILGRKAKRAALFEFSSNAPQNAVAIGDGANDLDMITAAGLGIAYRAKPVVAAAAHCAINYTDLTTALYFQGYIDSEITKCG